jgi:hypothetical protein
MHHAANQVPDMSATAVREANQVSPAPISPNVVNQPTAYGQAATRGAYNRLAARPKYLCVPSRTMPPWLTKHVA